MENIRCKYCGLNFEPKSKLIRYCPVCREKMKTKPENHLAKQSKGVTIFHLEFTSGSKKGKHFYFGSIASIFDEFNEMNIHIESKMDLYKFKIRPERPFANEICTIRKSMISRKKGNRKNPEFYKK